MEVSFADASEQSDASVTHTGNAEIDAMLELKARLSGLSRTVTRQKSEHEQYRAAAEAEKAELAASLATTKAELAEQNATLAARLAAAESALLSAKYPAAAAILAGGSGLTEEHYARLEARLAAQGDDDAEPMIASTNPRSSYRTPAVPGIRQPLSGEGLLDAMRSGGFDATRVPVTLEDR